LFPKKRCESEPGLTGPGSLKNFIRRNTLTLIYVGGQGSITGGNNAGLVQSANEITVADSTNPDSLIYLSTSTNQSTGLPTIANAAVLAASTLQLEGDNWGPVGSTGAGSTANILIEHDAQTLPPTQNSPAAFNFQNSISSTAKYLQSLNNANIGTTVPSNAGTT
jgi:hypothetical protein